jgi:hypothetical protein
VFLPVNNRENTKRLTKARVHLNANAITYENNDYKDNI